MHGAATQTIVDLVSHPALQGAELELKRFPVNFIPYIWRSVNMIPRLPLCAADSRLFSNLTTRCGHLHMLTFYDIALRMEDLQLGAACDADDSIRRFAFNFGTIVLTDDECDRVDPLYGVPAMKEVFKTLIRRKATLRLAFLVFDTSRWLQNFREMIAASPYVDMIPSGELPKVYLELQELAVTQSVPYVSEESHGTGGPVHRSRMKACTRWDMRRRDMV
jgi:hypothetical protein